MKIIISCCILLFIHTVSLSQEVVNLVLVGDDGVTENIKKAHSFIIIKKYPDGFKRLDYKIGAPLQRFRSYTDSTLKVLEGVYIEYGPLGFVARRGYYSNNLKTKNWYSYDINGKEVLLEKYKDGNLVSTLNTDTLKKDKATSDNLKPGEIEAKFKNGDAGWIKYLTRNLNANVAVNSVKGGQVVVQFIVNTIGKCIEVNLYKSVEFVLDEEAIKIIEHSPLWQPAVQDGRNVNAYRRQPITFTKHQ